MNLCNDILRLLGDGALPENVVYNKFKHSFLLIQDSLAMLHEHRLIEYCYEGVLCITEAGRKEIHETY